MTVISCLLIYLMEPVFDKDIDAMLRSIARDDAPRVASGDHIDADAIAAFVENALPDANRSSYIAHFADCDDCRKVLAAAVKVSEPVAMADAVSPATVTESIADPWYRRLVRTPILAYGMGALVLGFGAILYYQSTLRDADSVAQLNSEAANAAPAPAVIETPASANLTSTAAEPDIDQQPSANANISLSGVPSAETRSTAAKENATRVGNNAAATDDSSSLVAQAPPPPPPAAITTDRPAAAAPPKAAETRDERKSKASDAESSDITVNSRSVSELPARDDAALRSRREDSRISATPSRAPQIANSNTAAIRRVGGRSFANRNGVWTDTAYSNQQLTMIRRGTDNFRSLDGGLRSIANEIAGPVIVIWKGKGYRIN